MIAPAITHKSEVEEQFKTKYYSTDMFYYIGAFESYLLNIADDTEQGRYDWVVMDDHDKVIGYIGYHIDWYNSTVHNFGMICFDDGNPMFGVGIKQVFDLIFSYDIHRIEWCMVAGNPVEKHYDKFCKQHNGDKVVLHDVVKDQYGKWHDEYIYEIIREV